MCPIYLYCTGVDMSRKFKPQDIMGDICFCYVEGMTSNFSIQSISANLHYLKDKAAIIVYFLILNKFHQITQSSVLAYFSD